MSVEPLYQFVPPALELHVPPPSTGGPLVLVFHVNAAATAPSPVAPSVTAAQVVMNASDKKRRRREEMSRLPTWFATETCAMIQSPFFAVMCDE